MTKDLHTYREIKQQPRVWKQSYSTVLARKEEIKSFLDKYIGTGYVPVLTGAGTSAYIGDALEPALKGTLLDGARSLATTDIITAPELYFDGESKVLLISFARSGNSPESVGAVRAIEATAGSVAHIFITCNPDGELARMKGDHILTILLPPETNDLSLAMTSSYSTMLLTCAMISEIGRIEEEQKWIDSISSCVEAAMEKYEAAICEISSRPFHRAVFLGSGPLKGVAEESRLKLQELTDGAIMCAYDSFLGFRHGPKAIVKEDTLMVYITSPDPKVLRYEKDLIAQVAANNNVVASVVVCPVKPEGLPEGSYHLCVETGVPAEVPARYACVSNIFVAQLLGFYKSLDCGLCPDSPSVSGNISRVVEGVILYI